jgi:hypothetical protein
MGTPEGQQKSIFNTPKANKTKKHTESLRQSLQAKHVFGPAKNISSMQNFFLDLQFYF